MDSEYKKMLERFEQICQNAKKELCGKKEKEQEKKFIEKIDKGLTISEYDEIEYWLTNVEVLDNTDYILNNRKAKILVRYLKEKQQEIDRLNEELGDANYTITQLHKVIDSCYVEKEDYDRLNNIINELENRILTKLNRYYGEKDYRISHYDLEELFDKLKELKENNK